MAAHAFAVPPRVAPLHQASEVFSDAGRPLERGNQFANSGRSSHAAASMQDASTGGTWVAAAAAVVGAAVGAAKRRRLQKMQRNQAASSVPMPGQTLTPETLGWDLTKDEEGVLRQQLIDAIDAGGLEGKALQTGKTWPSKSEVLQAIPKDCLKRDTLKSLIYAASSLLQVGVCGYLAWRYIPMTTAALPLWFLYAAVQGTLATGAWVIGHECGHGAFSDTKWIQTLVGYTFHTALLVPYFSWQRSHAVHHAKTNHMTEGETHVPKLLKKPVHKYKKVAKAVGSGGVAMIRLATHLVFGWPAYLMTGATGGPSYGKTNHMWPYRPFGGGELDLFPGSWKSKVLQSDLGLIAFCCLLGVWAKATSVATVAALYFGPLSVTNMWLVLYTWLQHTDVDVPHFDKANWTWAKGAFHTIDRPYGKVLDFIHHRIGSTHVAHHVCAAIPHYKAVKATEALKEKFPDLYLYDPTPIGKALIRVAHKCCYVRPSNQEGMHLFV